MSAKKAVGRSAAGAAFALVLVLIVVASVAAATRGDRTRPTTPTNLRVTGVSLTSATLAWDPSTDKSSFFCSVNMDGPSFTVPQTRTTCRDDATLERRCSLATRIAARANATLGEHTTQSGKRSGAGVEPTQPWRCQTSPVLKSPRI